MADPGSLLAVTLLASARISASDLASILRMRRLASGPRYYQSGEAQLSRSELAETAQGKNGPTSLGKAMCVLGRNMQPRAVLAELYILPNPPRNVNQFTPDTDFFAAVEQTGLT